MGSAAKNTGEKGTTVMEASLLCVVAWLVFTGFLDFTRYYAVQTLLEHGAQNALSQARVSEVLLRATPTGCDNSGRNCTGMTAEEETRTHRRRLSGLVADLAQRTIIRPDRSSVQWLVERPNVINPSVIVPGLPQTDDAFGQTKNTSQKYPQHPNAACRQLRTASDSMANLVRRCPIIVRAEACVRPFSFLPRNKERCQGEGLYILVETAGYFEEAIAAGSAFPEPDSFPLRGS